jgi:hypothetical protein
MNARNLLVVAFVLLTIVFASLAFIEYDQVSNLRQHSRTETQITTRTVIQTTTQTISQRSQIAPVVYHAASITLPVTCCTGIPDWFVVGDAALGVGHTYGFNVTTLVPSCPAGATCTFTEEARLLGFKVYRWTAPPLVAEWANFTSLGYFNQIPSPANSTLFDGGVIMYWTVNSTILYLHIATM